MRKIIILLVLMFSSLSIASSQDSAIDKGAIIISGLGSFSTRGGDLFEDDEGYRLTTYMLMPNINYFIASNLFIGGGVALTRQKQGHDSQQTFGIGPTIGYAMGLAKSKNYPYLAAGIRYYSLGFVTGESLSGTDIVIGAGLIATVTENLGIIVEAGYHIMNLKYENSIKSESGNIISVGIGVAGLIF